jgi:hypothetical protein
VTVSPLVVENRKLAAANARLATLVQRLPYRALYNTKMRGGLTIIHLGAMKCRSLRFPL